MNENIFSRKKKLGKKFKLMWALIALTLVVVTAVSFIPYSKYKKVQEFAVTATLATDTSNQFTSVKDDYNELVRKMYKFYTPNHFSTTINGIKIDNSEVVSTAREADKALGNVIESAGYGSCYRGSDYLEYIGYIEYTTNKFIIPFIVWLALAVILLLINIMYAIDRKKTLIIEDDRIICKNGKKTVKEFFIRDVNSIDATKLSGLKIRGNSIKYQIKLLDNADEIKSAIMDSLSKANEIPQNTPAPAPVPAPQLSNIDELKKYKELLDMGVISEEDFEAKKKQLLNI